MIMRARLAVFVIEGCYLAVLWPWGNLEDSRNETVVVDRLRFSLLFLRLKEKDGAIFNAFGS